MNRIRLVLLLGLLYTLGLSGGPAVAQSPTPLPDQQPISAENVDQVVELKRLGRASQRSVERSVAAERGAVCVRQLAWHDPDLGRAVDRCHRNDEEKQEQTRLCRRT